MNQPNMSKPPFLDWNSVQGVIENELRCVRCHKFIFTNIRQCTEGHNFCGPCFRSIQTCIHCQATKAEGSNRPLHMLRLQMRMSCRYQPLGCNVKPFYVCHQNHETFCDFALTQCLLARCVWRGNFHEWKAHCVESHSSIYQGPYTKIVTTRPSQNKDIFDVIFEHGTCFFIRWSVDSAGSRISATNVGQHTADKRYFFILTVRRRGTEIGSETHRGECFHIDHPLFQSSENIKSFDEYFHNDELIYEIQIEEQNSTAGKLQSCQDEGARVAVDSIVKGRCFSCVCKNGYVWCSDGCPKTDGCHMLVEEGCCKRCKGCIYNGIYHPSDSEWQDKSSPCTVMRCEAGVITVSDLLCYTPCANPLPPEPGKCCPTCPECKINDQIVTDDREVTLDDPCLKCRCSGSRMTCSKKACPVLQCTSQRQEPLKKEECCPRCKGTRALMPIKNTCTLQTSFFRDGDSFSKDHCTNCTCQNETSICRKHSCPILDCALDLQISKPGSCCKTCLQPQEFRSSCYYKGVEYQDGQQWKLGACGSCKCQRGMPSCAKTLCNTTSIACPDGTRLLRLPGECCPKCVEVEAACMVFGDPHYKTFDGRIYSFKGIGKYQLVADCINSTFSVRVANNLNEGSSSLTKRVAVKYLNNRINLQQKGRIKYNGTIITLPYSVEGNFRAEKKKENAVEIYLNNGVRIFWNFRSFVEVVVPPVFKEKVCGLCGNFNHVVQDDLRTRGGRVVTDREVLAFGASWCTGKKSDCEKKIRQHKPDKPMKKNNCKLFNSDMFSSCHSKLNFSKYYKACKMDMDHCHKGKNCYCDSLLAYARECNRLGAELDSWQKHAFCDQNSLRRKNKKRLHKSQRHQEALLLRQMPKMLNRTRGSISPVGLT